MKLKTGDLVRPGKKHGLHSYDCRSHGLVVEHLPKRKGYSEAAIIRWNDGAVELEIPEHLEILNESR